MAGTNKIPIKSLLLHISNVINASDLSSVTSCRVKEYLKHKFKDALPCENDLDIILENVIQSIKLSKALNGDSVHFSEGNYGSLETYDAFVGNEIKDQDKPIKKRILRKIEVCYVLKKGVDPNAYKAYYYTVKNPFTSETIRIIKPFSSDKKELSKELSAKVPKQNAVTPVSNNNMVPSVDSVDFSLKVPKPNAEKTVSKKNKKPEISVELKEGLKMRFKNIYQASVPSVDNEDFSLKVPKQNAEKTVSKKNKKPKIRVENKEGLKMRFKNICQKEANEMKNNQAENTRADLINSSWRRGTTLAEKLKCLHAHFGNEIQNDKLTEIIKSSGTLFDAFVKCTEITDCYHKDKDC